METGVATAIAACPKYSYVYTYSGSLLSASIPKRWPVAGQQHVGGKGDRLHPVWEHGTISEENNSNPRVARPRQTTQGPRKLGEHKDHHKAGRFDACDVSGHLRNNSSEIIGRPELTSFICQVGCSRST
ncbi:hypothetical protein VTK73DRAFT_5120 [Phialemonium thermophilum]|uniref:Uncharacterized protein n=1 Tax=Phialemonium thermophilum TaxID=223376 RepID=A0ABR3WQA8_9PEZI